MLIVELNEFNAELLKRIADRRGFKNLKRMLAFYHTRTLTTDEYDSGFLEPWVQWVSVHTGTPSAVHGVKNLGDVPNLDQEQIWERWSRSGIRSIVWGVMNGSRRGAVNCQAFIPDPWTFSEDAYPTAYQNLIELPRYVAKNYLDFSKLKAAQAGGKLVRRLALATRRRDFVDAVKIFLRGLYRFGPSNLVFIAFFEYLSAMAFIHAVEREKPHVAIVFLNILAHVQHHYWVDPSGLDCLEVEYAASTVDQILGKLEVRCAAAMKDDRLVVLNALSQTCTSDEEPWILYRPTNHIVLMEFLGIGASKVEPLMTYDAHVFFRDECAARRAHARLSSAKVEGIPVFYIERDPLNKCKIFYRVAVHRILPQDAELVFQGGRARFAQHFTAVVQRTGKHISEGDLFSNFETPGTALPNHEAGRWLEAQASVGN